MLSLQTALLKRMMNNCFCYGPHESITVRSEHSGAVTMCGLKQAPVINTHKHHCLIRAAVNAAMQQN
eukprot:10186-Heterococcus_DN1.PRE.2